MREPEPNHTEAYQILEDALDKSNDERDIWKLRAEKAEKQEAIIREVSGNRLELWMKAEKKAERLVEALKKMGCSELLNCEQPLQRGSKHQDNCDYKIAKEALAVYGKGK